jgi:hypothetical protein
MPTKHTASVALGMSRGELDIETWLFALTDAEYQACANAHQGAGVFNDEQGQGMINVESIGGHLIVQHYRRVRANPSFVEMYSPASRIYLFHLVPVAAEVRWTLELTPTAGDITEFACTVQVDLPARLRALAWLSFLGRFLRNHVEEEARGFAADIARKTDRARRVTSVA